MLLLLFFAKVRVLLTKVDVCYQMLLIIHVLQSIKMHRLWVKCCLFSCKHQFFRDWCECHQWGLWQLLIIQENCSDSSSLLLFKNLPLLLLLQAEMPSESIQHSFKLKFSTHHWFLQYLWAIICVGKSKQEQPADTVHIPCVVVGLPGNGNCWMRAAWMALFLPLSALSPSLSAMQPPTTPLSSCSAY